MAQWKSTLLETKGPWVEPHRRQCLVLVQPRKTCPCLTERLLMRRKESKKKKSNYF